MTTESVLTKIPENTSFLQPTKFTLLFPNLPFLRYFGQTATIPGISTTPVSIETPLSNTWRHGDKLVFDTFTINAVIDEDMRIWEETYNWLISYTKPREFSQYKNGNFYPDAILTVNTNANIPNIRFRFTNTHPIAMGGINFNVAENANTIMTADITFRYDLYELLRN